MGKRKGPAPRFAGREIAFPKKLGRCRWCGDPVKLPARYWHPECVKEYTARRSPAGLRRAVEARDRGVCSACNLDCLGLKSELGRWARGRHADLAARARAGLGVSPRRKTFWDADHVLEVAAGGGSCGLDNVRTLCVWCHWVRTGKRLRGVPPGTGAATVLRVLGPLRDLAREADRGDARRNQGPVG